MLISGREVEVEATNLAKTEATVKYFSATKTNAGICKLQDRSDRERLVAGLTNIEMMIESLDEGL